MLVPGVKNDSASQLKGILMLHNETSFSFCMTYVKLISCAVSDAAAIDAINISI